MKHWPKKALGELLKVQNGFAFKSELFNEEGRGLPIIRIRDLARGFSETFYSGEYDPSFEVKTGDFLIGMDGEFRCYQWQGGKALLNQRVCRLQDFSSDINASYIFYGINEHLLKIEDNTAFVTVKHLSSKQIAGIEMKVPPLKEQERLVKLLDEADDLRKLRADADCRSSALIPALFHEMFGESVLRRKGWQVCSLGELIADGPQNGLYKHASFYGEGTPILRIDAFYDGELEDITKLKRLRTTPEERERYVLHDHDIVINRVNSPEYLGKSALIPALPEATVFESNMMRFSIATELLDPVYLICFLQMPVAKRHILGRAKHSINQSSINQGDVKSLPIPIPPLVLQSEFSRRVAEIRQLVASQSTSRNRLDKFFKSMLHGAFAGES